MVAIASLLATSLVAFAGTSESRADGTPQDIPPDLSFIGSSTKDWTGLQAPYGMAYDKYGNLWVANNRQANESIVMFSWDAQ